MTIDRLRRIRRGLALAGIFALTVSLVGSAAATGAKSSAYEYSVVDEFSAPYAADIAIDVARGTAYLSDGDSTVSALDLSTRRTAPVATCSEPLGMSIDTARHQVWVACGADDSDDQAVLVIDETTGATVRAVHVSGTPRDVALDRQRARAYVVDQYDQSVVVLDEKSGHVVDTIPLTSAANQGPDPVAIAVDPSTDRAYTANINDNTLSVIDLATDRVRATIPAGLTPTDLAIDPRTHMAYASDYLDRSVSVVDLDARSLVKTIRLGIGDHPDGVALDPGTGTVYVSNTGSGYVSVIDERTNDVTDDVGVGEYLEGIAVDPTNHRAYVADQVLTLPGYRTNITEIAQSGPTVSAISPASGPARGGQSITITGRGFSGTSRVLFGHVPATTFTVDSDTRITATTPARNASTVHVRVENTGLSAKTKADRYRFE